MVSSSSQVCYPCREFSLCMVMEVADPWSVAVGSIFCRSVPAVGSVVEHIVCNVCSEEIRVF